MIVSENVELYELPSFAQNELNLNKIQINLQQHKNQNFQLEKHPISLNKQQSSTQQQFNQTKRLRRRRYELNTSQTKLDNRFQPEVIFFEKQAQKKNYFDEIFYQNKPKCPNPKPRKPSKQSKLETTDPNLSKCSKVSKNNRATSSEKRSKKKGVLSNSRFESSQSKSTKKSVKRFEFNHQNQKPSNNSEQSSSRSQSLWKYSYQKSQDNQQETLEIQHPIILKIQAAQLLREERKQWKQQKEQQINDIVGKKCQQNRALKQLKQQQKEELENIIQSQLYEDPQHSPAKKFAENTLKNYQHQLQEVKFLKKLEAQKKKEKKEKIADFVNKVREENKKSQSKKEQYNQAKEEFLRKLEAQKEKEKQEKFADFVKKFRQENQKSSSKKEQYSQAKEEFLRKLEAQKEKEKQEKFADFLTKLEGSSNQNLADEDLQNQVLKYQEAKIRLAKPNALKIQKTEYEERKKQIIQFLSQHFHKVCLSPKKAISNPSISPSIKSLSNKKKRKRKIRPTSFSTSKSRSVSRKAKSVNAELSNQKPRFSSFHKASSSSKKKSPRSLKKLENLKIEAENIGQKSKQTKFDPTIIKRNSTSRPKDQTVVESLKRLNAEITQGRQQMKQNKFIPTEEQIEEAFKDLNGSSSNQDKKSHLEKKNSKPKKKIPRDEIENLMKTSKQVQLYKKTKPIDEEARLQAQKRFRQALEKKHQEEVAKVQLKIEKQQKLEPLEKKYAQRRAEFKRQKQKQNRDKEILKNQPKPTSNQKLQPNLLRAPEQEIIVVEEQNFRHSYQHGQVNYSETPEENFNFYPEANQLEEQLRNQNSHLQQNSQHSQDGQHDLQFMDDQPGDQSSQNINTPVDDYFTEEFVDLGQNED